MTTVGLLRVGHIDVHSRHVAGDYLELYRALLEPRGIDLLEFQCDEGDLPASLDDCDGWLCSPSRSSAYDDLPWVPEVESLLRTLVAEERPLVGICFGHQLLAQSLGGKVDKAAGGWNVGVHAYEIVAAPAWMDGDAPERLELIASHQDQVIAAPDGATVFATNAVCPNAGMLIGERAWTLQGHPELTAPLADSLLAGRIELLGADVVSEARASLARPTDEQAVAGWMARFFS